MIKVDLLDSLGNDLTVVNAARVSFDKHKEKFEDSDEKLINYLARHKHITPFGHCFASFRVSAPIFVRSQLAKHEYLRINEVSRRYVDTEPVMYAPDAWRGRPTDKKQGSTGFVTDTSIDAAYSSSVAEAVHTYNRMVRDGVAPEQARMVLPQAMMTQWYWSGSLDAFAKMCKLRLQHDAQYESQLVAQAVSTHMEELFPVSWKALMSH